MSFSVRSASQEVVNWIARYSWCSLFTVHWIYIYIYMYLCILIILYIPMYIYIFNLYILYILVIYICMYIYIYIYIYMYVCMHIVIRYILYEFGMFYHIDKAIEIGGISRT